MSTLSGTSTDAQVFSAFDDNASFEEDSSTAKALAYLTACRILLRRQPGSMSADGISFAFDAMLISSELARASRWLAANRKGAGTKYLSFTTLRD